MIAPDSTRTALAAVLLAADLDAARAAAQAGLDRLEAETSSGPVEADEAAAMAGMKPPAIRKWGARLRRGRVKNWISYKIGGRVYFDRARLVAFIAGGAP